MSFGARASVSHPEEQQWIRHAQQGDRAAFAALVEHYWPRVQRWLFGLTRNAHAAEDLTQDVLLKVWVGLKSFQAGTHFRAWLFRIASNCYLDSRRGPRAAARKPLPDGLAGREPDPAAAVLQEEAQGQVRAALDKLPVRFRGPFLLRTQEDLSFQDIAAALGLTEETARWRVFKARRLLLQQLGETLDGARR